MRGKVLHGILASLALVVASGVTYRVATGECPCAALCRAIHGDSKTVAQTPAAKPTAP